MRDLVVTLNENHWVVVVDEIVPIRDFDENVIKEPTPLKWLFCKSQCSYQNLQFDDVQFFEII